MHTNNKKLVLHHGIEVVLPHDSRDGAELATLCRRWRKGKSCNVGCRMRHFVISESEETMVNFQREWSQRDRQYVNVSTEQSHLEEDKQWKSCRARVFAAWITKTFGDDLKRGMVLDVAGGKGDVGLELSLVHGVPCTVVDPRLSPKRFQTQIARFVRKRFGRRQLRDARMVGDLPVLSCDSLDNRSSLNSSPSGDFNQHPRQQCKVTAAAAAIPKDSDWKVNTCSYFRAHRRSLGRRSFRAKREQHFWRRPLWL
mmetsp:Transcript_28180/g.45651  ORF Transcript_28180/g.45651 Transcript_28180/m.45651 type:complete len:255 (+) Transcript_28180:90-854(+)